MSGSRWAGVTKVAQVADRVVLDVLQCAGTGGCVVEGIGAEASNSIPSSSTRPALACRSRGPTAMRLFVSTRPWRRDVHPG